MFNWKAENQILLDEQVGGKGRHFSTRFLQPGLVKYSFGVCLLEKQVIDRFIQGFVGCPVIINHKDVTSDSAKDDRVGVISRVWFDDHDGWYWGEGVIFDQEALDLIDKGYNVSCQYEITEYSSTGGVHNGNNYDKTILNGKPEHLAIVQNPRYENAMIAVNAMEIEEMEAKNDNGYWFSTETGSHIHVDKGETKKEAMEKKFNDKSDDKKEVEFEEAPEELKKEDSEDYKDLEKQRDGLMKQVQGLKKRLESATTKDAKEAIQRGIDARKERIGKLEDAMIKEKKKAKNDIISVMNELKAEIMYAINEDKKQFVTVGEGESAHAIPVDYLKKDKKETTTKQADKKEDKQEGKLLDFNKKLQEKYAKEEEQENKKVSSTYKQSLLKEYKNIKENIRKDILDKSKRIDSLLKFAKDKPEEAKFHIADAEKLFKEIEEHENEYKYASEQIQEILKLEEKPKKQETTQLKLFSKNDIIQAINEIKGLDMFKNLFKKKEKQMDREEIKSIMMECLTELTASNEAEKKDEPDYKKMYEDLKAENEKAKEEAEKKAEEKEDKKEEKVEEAENKCDKAKNSIEAQKEAMMSEVISTKSTYVTQIKARELGKELF